MIGLVSKDRYELDREEHKGGKMVAAWMRGEFGGEWIYICMTESLPCSPETITTLLIGCTPTQKKKFKI